MSEVNADGVLINPQEALLQEVQHVTNKTPEGLGTEVVERTIKSGNGAVAGKVGGAPHAPTHRARKPSH